MRGDIGQINVLEACNKSALFTETVGRTRTLSGGYSRPRSAAAQLHRHYDSKMHFFRASSSKPLRPFQHFALVDTTRRPSSSHQHKNPPFFFPLSLSPLLFPLCLSHPLPLLILLRNIRHRQVYSHTQNPTTSATIPQHISYSNNNTTSNMKK